MTTKDKNRFSYKGTPVQRKRLKRFIEYMKNVEEETFDIRTVCHINFYPTSKEGVVRSIKNACGTTACIAGHLPVFNPSRFEYVINNGNFSYFLDIKEKGKRSRDFEKIFSDYFGISKDICRSILYQTYSVYGYNAVKPKDVVVVLKRILEGKNIYGIFNR